MPTLEELNPFPPEVRAIAVQWRENKEIITDPSAFKNLRKTKSGISHARWMRDKYGNKVVVKNQDGNIGIANEKVAADLAAYLGLPVPPGQLWNAGTDADDFRFVSLNAFAKSKDNPPEDLLEQDPFRAAMTVFDVWIRNKDRHTGNVVYEVEDTSYLFDLFNFRLRGPKTGLPAPPAKLAYIDHSFSLDGKVKNFRQIMFWNWDDLKLTPEEGIAELETPGSVGRSILQRIQLMPDEAIAEIVNNIPDALYSRDHKDKVISFLCYRRNGLADVLPVYRDGLPPLSVEEQARANETLLKAICEKASSESRDNNSDPGKALRPILRMGADIYMQNGLPLLRAIETGQAEMTEFILNIFYGKRRAIDEQIMVAAIQTGKRRIIKLVAEQMFDSHQWRDKSFAELESLQKRLHLTFERIRHENANNDHFGDISADIVIDPAGNARHAILNRLSSQLCAAAKEGDLSGIAAAIAAGADINYEMPDVPLRVAAQHGCIQAVKELLERGANASALSNRPLRAAAKYGHADIVRLLLEAGASPIDNDTLELAQENRHRPVVRLLKQWLKDHSPAAPNAPFPLWQRFLRHSGVKSRPA